MIMDFAVHSEHEMALIMLPATEKEIQRYCDKLKIANDMKSVVDIAGISAKNDFFELIQDREINITKLNYLAKRLESFTDDETSRFYAIASAKKLVDIKDLINLTFNLHCYSVVSDFCDIYALGKKLYQNENSAVNEELSEDFNGKEYVEKMTRGQVPLFSPYGYVYANKNQPQEHYYGNAFPELNEKKALVAFNLSANGEHEYLPLPYEQSELEKALERLVVNELSEAEVTLAEHKLPEQIYNIAINDDIGICNDFVRKLESISKSDLDYLATLVEMTKITEQEEFHTLMNSMFEFEFIPNVYSPEQYGKYLLCDSGRFDYDENLQGYIHFHAYGEDKIKQENGTFTSKGYLNYMGYNQDICKILNKNLSLDIQLETSPQTLKLYMPLEITTYYEEDMYGHYQQSDNEGTMDAYELIGFEDELNDFLQDYQPEMDTERKMMEYYGANDSVNAKVKCYHFEFEEVNKVMYGVVVAELNAPLNDSETKAFKETIVGQAADGLGETLEQREFNLRGRDVYIHLWNSENDWYLKTEEEMGFAEQDQRMEMI